jgi:signal transduction histidine kinase
MLQTNSLDEAPSAPQTSHHSPATQCNFSSAINDARMRSSEQAEKTARQGTIELMVDFDSEEISSSWSAGINALLQRESIKEPLSRQMFIQRYVHPDDRQILSKATKNVLAGNHPAELRYRLLPEDASILDVAESWQPIVPSAVGRIFFVDLKVVSQSPNPVALAPLFLCDFKRTENSFEVSETISAVMSTFDAWKEKEQQRLACEIHDDFGQLLATMKLDLCLLQKESISQNGSVLRHVGNLQELVDTMIVSARRIISELPPKAIEDLGVFGAINQLVTSIGRSQTIQFVFKHHPHQIQLKTDLELSLYRIVQEALHNIVRHANATSASVEIALIDSCIHLTVADNGRGLASADLVKTRSCGLLWMRERVVRLNGVLSLKSEPNKGTKLIIKIPVLQET